MCGGINIPTANFWRWGEGSESQQQYFASQVPEWQFAISNCPGDMSISQARQIIEKMIREQDFEEGEWAFSFSRSYGTSSDDFKEVGHCDSGSFI